MSYFTRLPMMPLSNVAPFSERDAVTYAQMLADLRSAIVRLAGAQVDLDGKMDARLAQWNASLDTLETEIGAAIELVVTAGDQYLPEMNSLYNQLKTLADEIEPLLATSQRLDQEISDRKTMGQTLTDLNTATNGRVDTLTSTVSVINGELESVYGMTPAAFGAVGDGNADDTSALEDWANSGGSTLEPGRVYRTSRPVHAQGNGRILHGNGSRVVYTGDDSLNAHAVRVDGDHATVRNFDIVGNGGGIATGIRVTGHHATVTGNRVRDLLDVAGAIGIRVEGWQGGHLVNDNTIYNIRATGDGVVANSSGLARGITLYGDGSGNAQHASIVSGNRISDISGEEGDGISILWDPVGGYGNISSGHARSRVDVRGNTIDDCSRRAIKVQGSDTDVSGNTIHDSIFGNEDNPASSINFINSHRIRCGRNSIRPTMLRGIAFHNPDIVANDIQVNGNSVMFETGVTGSPIYLENAIYFEITGNSLTGGHRQIGVGGSTAGVISGNAHHRLFTSTSNFRYVGVITGSDRVAVTNNTAVALVNAGNAEILFQNDSANGITDGNYVLNPA